MMQASFWRESPFVKLWSSESLHSLSDILVQVVVIVQVYRMTDSILGAATVPAVTALGSLVGGMTASFWIHHFSLVKVMRNVSWIRVLLVLVMGGLFTQQTSVALAGIYVTLWIQAVCTSWYQPARFALLPLVVSKYHVVKANGAVSLIHQIWMTAGWAVGGLLSVWVPFTVIIALVAGGFFLSGILVGTISPKKKSPVSAAKVESAWKDVWRLPVVRSITLMDASEALANTIWTSALLLGFTYHVLQEGNQWWGFLNAAYFIGAIMGGLIAVYQSRIMEKNIAGVIALSSLSMGGLTLLLTVVPVPVFALLLCILMGPMYQIRDVCQISVLQDVIPSDKRAGVMAARGALLHPWSALAILLMGWLADWLGVRFVFFLAAGLYALTALLVILQSELRNYRYRFREDQGEREANVLEGS